MRIAVTGASGFIGTELLAELKDRNHTVIALTRGGSAHADSHYCVWRETDYTADSLAAALEGADAVIHLAGVRGTTSDPDDYVVNEVMTDNLIRAMSAAQVRRIVFASTISVYDDVDTIPWQEEYPLRGRTMYGCSKIECEDRIRFQAEEKGYTFAIVRIAQVLGLGEKRRGMMNVFLDTARDGGVIRVMGKSEAKRQYIYVKDLVKILAMLAAAKGHDDAEGSPEGAEAAGGCSGYARGNITVNAGMPHAYTNLEIAKIVNMVYGNETPIDYDDSTPETIKPSCMDITRLKEEVGYVPMDMEESLQDIRSYLV